MAGGYDVIVIGAGSNGLTLASYLAKGGQKVLVLERLPYPGGGVTSREIIPGFTTSPHAVNHNWVHTGPIRKDLELEKFGSRYIFPEIIYSHIFSDGRSLTLYRDLESTVAEIAKFSKNDAARYRDWIRENEPTFEFITRATYAPPRPFSKLFGLLEETPSGMRALKSWLGSVDDVADALFENECVKVWFIVYCSQTVQEPHAKGTGLIPVALLVNQHRAGGNSLSVGGSQSMTTALVACLEAHGGELRTGCHVSRILTDGNRATGVALSDGTKIKAARAVVSNAEPHQVFQEMVDAKLLPEGFSDQIRNFRFVNFTIFGLHLALEENPIYRCEADAPNQAFNAQIGIDTQDEIRKHFYELSIGEPPAEPGFMVLHPTRYDPSIAPPGKHITIIWQYGPCHPRGGDQRWDEIKEEYADLCMEVYERFTLNLTDASVIGRLAYTPLDIARENISMVGGDMISGQTLLDQAGIFRPFHGYPPYRTPVDGLYLCGPSTHPRGGCHGACGYNAAGAVAEDIGMKPWWAGREYQILKN